MKDITAKTRKRFKGVSLRLEVLVDAVHELGRSVESVSRIGSDVLEALRVLRMNRNLVSVVAVVRGPRSQTFYRSGCGFVVGEGRELRVELGALPKGCSSLTVLCVGGLLASVRVGNEEVGPGVTAVSALDVGPAGNTPIPFVECSDRTRLNMSEGVLLSAVAVAP